jgi:UDP-GlcNAc3NAcA epimerase
LAQEGITGENVQQVGDVMFDAALYYAARAEQRSRVLQTLRLTPRSYVLATVHRAENTDDSVRMAGIIRGFAHSPLPVVWPLHPRTRARIASGGLTLPVTVCPIDPLGYLDMIQLERHAALIATDSGGVQKEAYFHGVPCITLRNETEWVELLEIGANRLVGADTEAIGTGLSVEIEKSRVEVGHARARSPYGDGDAGIKMVKKLAVG